ncbi:cytochrome o ubiquinol oxidase [Escherichia coli DEC14B]|nr:cytochrome o ubiquinol oxidase [Escherichia coli DEC14B]
MRKSFNGLGSRYSMCWMNNPFSGHLFIFRGRRGDTIKSCGLMLMVCACSPNALRKVSLSGLRCVTVRYPLPARNWQCSSISWTGVSQKHPALTH